MQETHFSKEIVNTGRQIEFDWAKTLAIVFMIMVHIYQYVTTVNYHVLPTDVFRNTIEFLGGPLAAPVFMFAMGMGMIYSRKNTSHDFMTRGIKLLIAGYALNLVRETIPLLFMAGIGQGEGESILYSLGNVDILHFAGMAFIAIAVMKRFNINEWKMLAISVLLQPLGVAIASLGIQNKLMQYVLDLFIHANEGSSFPLFSWLIYPVFGMCFALVLQRIKDKRWFYNRVLLIGILGFITTSSTYVINGYDLRFSYTLAKDFYWEQTMLQSSWIIFIILIAIASYFWLSEFVTNGKVVGSIKWISKNLRA
ncbi:heparan-alpha-glucosaminide N-acetyltransferase domain-containing protein [Levilactobacillus brevis]|uniref:heparan-alpha-glucosaminide N-acetyltransferase domain-containing protein n=1 Tax=Levilactobacillus brevis TaxID=1580 RepID=UPI00111AB85B|nr:heparan-alpha-glucosaminide N-acetyltransferase domain-containing protein [Levilactobacillus brevis]QCZ46839.1 hypothetical protein UCCLB556_1964 [Levilactobacillus brevis]